MPTGANPRREREFRKLEQQFRQDGRYRGREEEVATRIVNRQRAQAGETREAPKRKMARSVASDAPASDLPIASYQHLTVAQIRERLDGLSAAQRQRLRAYEAAHKKRKGLLQALAA
ncbi:hypothetical protein [Janthinobacterium violaceinigrum]|uniref:Uncharacterized protein n=1 Tax=Janthinobacterium violaceinigrum TaxID=2654252 RepID=A0A6I1I9F3_9BURK|nr:hypothetical protein [Janthinobacterium violaceinigrum]KAB8066720.1 hypothetical protein GCN75_00140 [Janthinobacterium violaceinigrum]